MAIMRRRSPLGGLLDLQKRLEDIFPWDEEGETTLTTWRPRVDVYEEGDNIVFECEAPGVDKNDIDVSIEDNRLTISGNRHEEKTVEKEDRDYYRSERFFGEFQRTFTLPEGVDAEQVNANFDNGVLKVVLPKAPEAKKRSIEIN
ncbi:MAG: Hsp20/alpha crystallin family protein [bacterium]